jgi:hypothetical protein
MVERFRTAPAMSPQLGVICRNQPRLLAQVNRVFLSRIVVLCTGCPVPSLREKFVMRRRDKARSRHKQSISTSQEHKFYITILQQLPTCQYH